MAERSGRQSGGYTALGAEALDHALAQRGVARPEIDRVLDLLLQPDPAQVIPTTTREEVAHVAAYLHVRRGRAWIPLPAWGLIVRGHPAARAIWWHELQELEGYRRRRVRNPLRVVRGRAGYWRAHALASWEEARYWEAWAAAEGEGFPSAAAFLRSHPLRQPHEIARVLEVLNQAWRIDVEQPSVVGLRHARAFYLTKELTEAEVQRWLSL